MSIINPSVFNIYLYVTPRGSLIGNSRSGYPRQYVLTWTPNSGVTAVSEMEFTTTNKYVGSTPIARSVLSTRQGGNEAGSDPCMVYSDCGSCSNSCNWCYDPSADIATCVSTCPTTSINDHACCSSSHSTCDTCTTGMHQMMSFLTL